MKKTDYMKNNQMKTAIIAAIAVGIVGAILSGLYMAESVNAQTKNVLPNPLEAVNTIKVQHPEAKISEGLSSEALKNMPLKQIAEESKPSRPDQFDPRISTSDTDVTVSLYYDNSTNVDTVAITVKNSSPKTIFVDGLVVSGFIRGDLGSAIESVYRPIISNPFDVVRATTTNPVAIPSGKSLTAYIQGYLNAEGYGGLACYSDRPIPTTENDQAAIKAAMESHFCASLPLTWIK